MMVILTIGEQNGLPFLGSVQQANRASHAPASLYFFVSNHHKAQIYNSFKTDRITPHIASRSSRGSREQAQATDLQSIKKPSRYALRQRNDLNDDDEIDDDDAADADDMPEDKKDDLYDDDED